MANGVGKKVSMVVLLILAVLIGLMSAYGATCPLFHPERILLLEEGEILELSSYILHKVITEQYIYYLISNIVTWVACGLG
ncbi:MAG: hypothetical protein ACTSRD_07590, partial [Promethearchaeota archaeon]